MKLFNSKSLTEMSRDEIIDIILNTGTQKHLKGDINDASLEELIRVAPITHAGDKGMHGMAKIFFYLGLILFALFIVSIFRAHWMQAVIELVIAVLALAASSLLHIRQGIKSINIDKKTDIRKRRIILLEKAFQLQIKQTKDIKNKLIISGKCNPENISIFTEDYMFAEIKQLIQYIRHFEEDLCVALLEARLFYDWLWQRHFYNLNISQLKVNKLFEIVKNVFDSNWQKVFNSDIRHHLNLTTIISHHTAEKILITDNLYNLKDVPSDYNIFYMENREILRDKIDEYGCSEEQVLLTFLHTYKLVKSNILIKDMDIAKVSSAILPWVGGAILDIDNLLYIYISQDCIT